ncbi:MAG: hypothetical protein BroJett013_24940 [Alphaproteobacteria bacterium]|nr:MAG: hypothetical protein BroJett013_24940 [Alphaproteobacteria bacterium]
MSGRAVERALARLAAPGAVVAQERGGAGYGVFPAGDRRRRPVARLRADDVRLLASTGALEAAAGNLFVLSAAGRARVAREAAGGEGFLAQHAPLEQRAVVDAEGDLRHVRGVVRSTVLIKLSALRDGAGAPWLSELELAAAQRLRSDWEASQGGLTRGSDWRAPPIGGARGASNVQERAMAARCDARRRVADALDALAQPLRRVVERVCLNEDGLETLERAEGWPARSGKLALKLGLAQLARAFAA